MLKDRFAISSLLELTPATAASFCEAELDAEVLDDDLAAGRPFSRKRFCEYLGVAESTLSGWLKDDRIPRAIKEAYVLLLVVLVLQDEIKILRQKANDFKILKDGQSYKICLFEENEDGDVVGRVVADDLGTRETAREFVVARHMRRLLRETQCAIGWVLDGSENRAFLDRMRKLDHEIDSILSYTENFEEWRDDFGPKRREQPLPEIP